VRVILIIIAEHLQMMRTLAYYESENRVNVARESSFLYAPLAHRMGLYAIKQSLKICR
jgi:GTP pyrophosphokinase